MPVLITSLHNGKALISPGEIQSGERLPPQTNTCPTSRGVKTSKHKDNPNQINCTAIDLSFSLAMLTALKLAR